MAVHILLCIYFTFWLGMIKFLFKYCANFKNKFRLGPFYFCVSQLALMEVRKNDLNYFKVIFVIAAIFFKEYCLTIGTWPVTQNLKKNLKNVLSCKCKTRWRTHSFVKFLLLMLQNHSESSFFQISSMFTRPVTSLQHLVGRRVYWEEPKLF